jgi:hypothetical protein
MYDDRVPSERMRSWPRSLSRSTNEFDMGCSLIDQI